MRDNGKLGFRIITYSFLCLFILTCGSRSRVTTEFRENRIADQALGDQADALRQLLGDQRYAELSGQLGSENLRLLAFGIGVSNAMQLLESVSDPSRLVELLNAPDAVSADKVVSLLMSTDRQIIAENPPSSDTVGKIGNLINQVNDMDALKRIMRDLSNDTAGTDPQSAMDRLGLLIALIDEAASAMPTLINNLAPDVGIDDTGRLKLQRLVNEVVDIKKLAGVVNDISSLANLTSVIAGLTNDGMGGAPDGTDGLISTFNNVTDYSKFVTLVDNLAILSPDISNDDNFNLGFKLNWATTASRNLVWQVNSGVAVSDAALNDNELASLELAANITVAGNVEFYRAVSSHSSDYLKFYIDDVLQAKWSGTVTGSTVSYPIGTGVHRLRWEYVKDAANTAGSDTATIDNVVLPGDLGAARTGSQKVSIILNQLDVASLQNDTVASILEGVNTTGLNNLIDLINLAEFPANINDAPRLVSIVNGLAEIDTLTEILNNSDNNGTDKLLEVVNHTPTIASVINLLNTMKTAGLGVKLTTIINNLTYAGAYGISALVESANPNHITTIIRDVPVVAHLAGMLNSLELHGSAGETVVGNGAGPSGGGKLATVLNLADASAVISIDVHIVRLINDIANSPAGADNVGRIVGGLDPQAANFSGFVRIVHLLENLATQNLANIYADPLWNSTLDEFGRLTTLVADMGANGPSNIVRIANELNCTNLVSNCKINDVSNLVRNTTRIRYLSRLMSEATNIQLILDLINSSDATVIGRITTLVNATGNSTYGTGTFGSFAGPFYTDPLSNDLSDDLGRLILTINGISSAGGISNVITIINDIADLSKLSGLIAKIRTDGSAYMGADRVMYLTDLLNRVANIDLVMNILNGAGANPPAHFSNLVDLINNVGGSTRGSDGDADLIKAVGNMYILAEVINELAYDPIAMAPRPLSEQKRIVTLVNDVRYCGLQPAFDTTVQNGVYCSNSTYTNATDCTGAGATWFNANQFYNCDSHVDFAYDKNNTSYDYDRRERLSNFLLGINSAQTVATIVGGVTETQKTIRMLNGIRRVNTLIKAVDWMPGKVSEELVNTTHINAIFRAFVYLANNLETDEDMAAVAFASMIHFGTSIADSSSRLSGTCVNHSAIGPKRLGHLLNVETGQYLESILMKFGWRTGIPALVCAMGARSSIANHDPSFYSGGSYPAECSDTSLGPDGCQRLANEYPNNPQPPNAYSYFTQSERVTTAGPTYHYRVLVNNNCERYYPEITGALGFDDNTDRIVWRGFSGGIWPITITNDAGIAGVWDVIKGRGTIAWLLNNGGTLGLPPTVGGGQACAGGSQGNEWDCVKTLDGNGLPVRQWGNFCTNRAITNDETCRNSGYRWTPEKNYNYCTSWPADFSGPPTLFQ